MDTAGHDFVSIPGLALSAFGGICWFVSRALGHEARKIGSAKEYSKLSDLRHEAGNGPFLAAVTGVVSDHQSFKGELSKKDCVISQIDLQQHICKKIGLRMVERTIPLRNDIKEAHGWTITDSSGVHLPVIRGTSAVIDFKSVEKLWEGEKYFEGGHWTGGLARAALDIVSNVYVLGHNTEERSLTVGTPVTIVGEVASARRHKSVHASTVMVRGNKDRMLVIQKPSNKGDPFYITTQTLPELVASISSSASIFKWVSIGIGSIGLGLLTWKASCGGINLIRRKKLRARVLKANQRIAADRAAGRLPPSQHSETDNSTGNNAQQCCICLDSEADAVYTVCGHMCTCWSCSRRAGNRCPMCRTSSPAIQVYR